jgi:hypothetical protein
MLRALSGVANIRPHKDWKQSADRMVDLRLKGMQSKRETKAGKQRW